jgi:hypothetical protein
MKIKDYFQSFDIDPISTSPMHGPATAELVDYMRQRNEEKRQKSIEFLGDKWLLHPKNQQQKEVR